MKTDGSLGFWVLDPVQGLGFGGSSTQLLHASVVSERQNVDRTVLSQIGVSDLAFIAISA
jgi:hypothetical protein